MKLFARDGNKLVANNPSPDYSGRWLLPADGVSEWCCCPKVRIAYLTNCCCGVATGTNCLDGVKVDDRLIERLEDGTRILGPYKIYGRCYRVRAVSEPYIYPIPKDVRTYWNAGEGLVDGVCSDTYNDEDGECPPCGEPVSCCTYRTFPPCNIVNQFDPRPCCVLGSQFQVANTFTEEIIETGINPEDIRSRSDGSLAAPDEVELYRYRRQFVWRKNFASPAPGCPSADSSSDFYSYEISESRFLYDLEWTSILPDGTIPAGAQLVRVNERREATGDRGEVPGGITDPIEDVKSPVYLRFQDPPPVGTYPPHISFDGPGNACVGTYITDFYSRRGSLAFHAEESITGSMSGCFGSNGFSQQRYNLDSTEYFFPDQNGSRFQRRREYRRFWSSSVTITNRDGCAESSCPQGLINPGEIPPTVVMRASGGCGSCRDQAGI